MILVYILLLILIGIILYVLVALINSLILITKRPIRYLFNKRKEMGNFCNYYDLPYKTIDMLLALEDRQFFNHNGYDIDAIKNAFWFNVKTKKLTRGGSTITQQLVKNLYFKFKLRLFRKLSEFFISIYVEKKLSKIEILEFYVNVIYYGNEVYGLYDASKYYFNKNYKNLTVNQIFFLLCFLSAPTKANPYVNPDIFISLRNKKVKQLLWICDDKKYPNEIFSYGVDCLDPELVNREVNDCNIKLKNEKFGKEVFY